MRYIEKNIEIKLNKFSMNKILNDLLKISK